MKNLFLLTVCLLSRALAPLGNAQELSCPPMSADASVATCWLDAARQLIKNNRHDEGMALLKSLAPYTASAPLTEAQRLRLISRIYAGKTAYDSSLHFLHTADRLYRQADDPIGSSMVHNEIGRIMQAQNEWDKAAQHWYKAIEWADKAQADSFKIVPYNNLALLFDGLGDSLKTQFFLLRNYELALRFKDRRMTAIAGVDLMTRYIRANRPDSARIIAQQTTPMLGGQSPVLSACSRLAFAVWEAARGNRDKANEYYAQLRADSSLHGAQRIYFSYIYAKFLAQQRLYKTAQPIFETLLTDAAGSLEDLRDISKTYHRMLADMQDYKRAWEVAQIYMAARDSLHTADVEKKVREVNIKYETAEKERALHASGLKLIEKTYQCNLLMGGSMLATLLGIFLLMWQRARIRLAGQLLERESVIARQKIESIRMEQNHVAFKAMVAGEEAERNRLAKELHDGLGGMLSNIKLTLSKRPAPAEGQDLSETVKIVDNAGMELRRIAQNLMPEALAKFGLISALEDLCADTEQHARIQIAFQHCGIHTPLPENAALPVYRIVQEALTNIVKHAQASEAMVELIQEDGRLHLTIEDNGVGFDPETALAKHGNGLKNLRSRTAYLNGQIEFDSAPGKGTAINILIPLHNA